MLYVWVRSNAKHVTWEDRPLELLQSGEKRKEKETKSGVLPVPSNTMTDDVEEKQSYFIGLSVLTVLHCKLHSKYLYKVQKFSACLKISIVTSGLLYC